MFRIAVHGFASLVAHLFSRSAVIALLAVVLSPTTTEGGDVGVEWNAPTLPNSVDWTNADYAAISLTLSPTDPEGDVITYSAIGRPPALAVNATTRLISGTLSYTSADSHTAVVTATAAGGSDSKTTTAWTIAAVPIPSAPTIITVTARDAANNAATDTLTVIYNAAALPGAATVVAPMGTISTATPSFSWMAVSGATHYQLWVNDASTGAKINVTYPAAAVGCGAGTGTCTASPGVTLAPGTATWWIRTSNAAGAGPWSVATTVTVAVPAATSTAPGAASPVAPTGTISTATPSFSWTAVSRATHYQLWVNDASTGAKINVTYPAAAVGCGAGTGTCTVSPGVTLAPGAATWWILTSNAAGNGPWSAASSFVVAAATLTPGAATLVAPTGTISTATPSFSWTAISGATHYQLWVNDASAGAKITTTYPAAAAGCGAGTGTCTVSPGVTLAPGAARGWILTSNAAGNGPWSTALSFVVSAGTLTPPGAATLVAPTGTISIATPSFSWTAVSGATNYQLWVNDASTGGKINVTYLAAAVGCGAGTGTCTASPGVTLAPGTATWWILTSNAAGAGPWSQSLGFLISSPPTTSYGPKATITCPSGAYDLWPGTAIPFTVSLHPGGTTYCLRAGVHALTSAITPKTGDTFIGEYGAILDGTGWTTSDDTQAAFRAHNQDIDNVTIRNLVIRNMPQKGIHAFYWMSDHWTIEYNEIASNKTGLEFPPDFPIRNNYIHHNVGNPSSSNPAERGGGYMAGPPITRPSTATRSPITAGNRR